MEKLSQNNINTLKACRYCPMCRQSCPSEFIHYRESDAPRGRAILLYSVYFGKQEFEASAVQSIYNCFLCGACKSWCGGQDIGGYDIPELVKFARRDIVSRDLAPKAVQDIKNALVENENCWNIDLKKSFTATVSEKTADILYILGGGVNYVHPEIAEAFIRLLEKNNADYTLLKDEPASGIELDLLGYRKEAQEKAKIMFGRIKATGCKTIVVSDPLVYDALKNDYPAWGLGLETTLLHVSEYFSALIRSGKLNLQPVNKKVTLADSEFLGRYNGVYAAPREVLKATGDFVEMQWNSEYLQSAGEAAFTFDESLFGKGKGIDLGRKISRKAEEAGADIIVTLSATAKDAISATTDLKVIDIVEFIEIYENEK